MAANNIKASDGGDFDEARMITDTLSLRMNVIGCLHGNLSTTGGQRIKLAETNERVMTDRIMTLPTFPEHPKSR